MKTEDFDAKFARALLGRRQIFVGEFFKEETCHNIKKAVLYLNALSKKDIIMLFDSRGGDSKHLLTLSEVVHTSQAKVIGKVIGQAVSAAAALLQACHEREMTGNSSINPHMAIGIPNIELNAETDLVALSKKMKRFKQHMVITQTVYDKLFAKRMITSVKEVRKILASDQTYNAPMALQMGLVDRIV